MSLYLLPMFFKIAFVTLLGNSVYAGTPTNWDKIIDEQIAEDARIKKVIEDYERESLKEHSVRYAMSNGKLMGIMIEGEIRKGDFEEFSQFVKKADGKVTEVYLRTPGGSAVEAMKIGRLIRKLKMHTNVPRGSPAKPSCVIQRPLIEENCTCASSCFLIHAAGVGRSGSVIGVHRVFVAHAALRQATADEAYAASMNIKKELTSYFAEMGVPSAYTERILSIPSNKIEFLSSDEVEKNFTGLIPEYQEWISAKCGDYAKVGAEMQATIRKSKSPDRDPKVTIAVAKAKDVFDCESDLKKAAVKEAYDKHFKTNQ